MLASLVAGIAFALGHHYFYQALKGHVVSNTVFDQQINIAIGNAFAFLVRISLITSVGTAYVQLLWHTLRGQRLSIMEIDSLFSLLYSALDFFNFKAIRGHYLLVILGFVAWTLPLAVILPPATLTVELSQQASYSPQTFGVPDWNDGGWALQNSPNPSDFIPAAIEYNGAQPALKRTAQMTVFQDSISSIAAPSLNSSYTLNFIAPSLSCESTDASILDGFTAAFGCSLTASGEDATRCTLYNQISYLAWTPSADSIVPFTNQSVSMSSDGGSGNEGGNGEYIASFSAGSSYGPVSGGPARIFLASNAAVDNDATSEWSVSNCTLWNASYIVDFNFTNGQQNLVVTDLQYLNTVGLLNEIGQYCPVCAQTPVNGVWMPATTLYTTPASTAYQAVMDIFGTLLVGMIWTTSTDVQDNQAHTASTIIASTALPYTNGAAMLDAVPELFQNIIFSLFSNTVSNWTTTLVSDVNVTHLANQNVYVYTWRRLAISYAIAVVVSIFVVITGLVLVVLNGASYSNKFSTVLRTTRGSDIDKLVENNDRTGIDPLPEELGKARIWIGPLNEGSDTEMIMSTTS